MQGLPSGLLQAIHTVAAQVDPNSGTMVAAVGAKARLQDPTLYDAVFPFIAFLLVIVLPASIAMWVAYKTITDDTKEADET